MVREAEYSGAVIKSFYRHTEKHKQAPERVLYYIMVPHIATEAIISSNNNQRQSSMTNSEMELNGSPLVVVSGGGGVAGGSSSSSGFEVCDHLEDVLHLEDGTGTVVVDGGRKVVFGSQMIDQNSATPYSDATKVRANRKKICQQWQMAKN